MVLVGIGTYGDKQIKARKHAEADAKALYDLFTDKKYLGAEADNVRLLLGQPDDKRRSRPATRQNILAALEWLASSARPDDLTIFAFVGEGGPLGTKSDRRCYFASDSTFKEPRQDRHRLRRRRGAVAEAQEPPASAAFVDVDFKGFVDLKTIEPTLGSSPYREFLGDDKTDEHGAPARPRGLPGHQRPVRCRSTSRRTVCSPRPADRPQRGG